MSMRNVSLKAWNTTIKILFKEVKRHITKSKLINSWNIAGNYFKISKKVLDVYQKKVSQFKLSTFTDWEHERESLSSAVIQRCS